MTEILLERIEDLEALHDEHENHEARLCALERQHYSQGLRERWWATYNAALTGLLTNGTDQGCLQSDYIDDCRDEARRIADAEHGKVPSVRFEETP